MTDKEREIPEVEPQRHERDKRIVEPRAVIARVQELMGTQDLEGLVSRLKEGEVVYNGPIRLVRTTGGWFGEGAALDASLNGFIAARYFQMDARIIRGRSSGVFRSYTLRGYSDAYTDRDVLVGFHVEEFWNGTRSWYKILPGDIVYQKEIIDISAVIGTTTGGLPRMNLYGSSIVRAAEALGVRVNPTKAR